MVSIETVTYDVTRRYVGDSKDVYSRLVGSAKVCLLLVKFIP